MSRKRPREEVLADVSALRCCLERWVRRRRTRALHDRVLACAKRVYKELRWGWNENVYREALAVELQHDGLMVQSEISRAILYRGQPLSHVSVKMDMVVEGELVLELKAIPAANPGLEAMTKAAQQCARYLRLIPSLRSGLVLNFPDKADKHVVSISLT